MPPNNAEPVECYLLDSNKITGRFSTAEIKQMQDAEHAEREAYRSTEDLQSSVTNHRIDTIIEKAVAAFPEKPEMSRRQRVSDIKANRKEEMEKQYQESVSGRKNPTPASSAPVQGKSLIQQMLEAELNEAYGLD